MLLSIAILVATKNRFGLLQKMLQSLTQMEVPEGVRVELHVVDNGSNDGTATLLDKFVQRFPVAVSLFGHQFTEPGKSKALNYAMGKTNCNYLVFIDDDVQVSKFWLVELLAGFDDPKVDAIQGGVQLHIPTPPPWWLTPRVQAICAATTLWRSDAPVTSLNGSNMAVRNDGQLPPFCEEIGPGRQPYPMGEDAEWSMRLLAQGRTGRFCPEAMVYHDFDSRLKLSEVLARQVHSGQNQLVFAIPSLRSGLVFEALWQLPYSLAKAALRWSLGKRLAALDNLLDAARYWGTILGPLSGIHRHPCWRGWASPERSGV